MSNGTITTKVHGSHVHVTVRLRRRWALWTKLLDHQLTDEEVRRYAIFCGWFGKVTHDALLVAVILAGTYLLFEVGTAFLPGGPVEQVLKAVR